jgi:hypothetical protein
VFTVKPAPHYRKIVSGVSAMARLIRAKFSCVIVACSRSPEPAALDVLGPSGVVIYFPECKVVTPAAESVHSSYTHTLMRPSIFIMNNVAIGDRPVPGYYIIDASPFLQRSRSWSLARLDQPTYWGPMNEPFAPLARPLPYERISSYLPLFIDHRSSLARPNQ